MADNEEMIAYWNGPAAESWASTVDEHDRDLEVLGAAAIEALALGPGAAVLDVGCGPGTTTIALAERVGPTGRVVGVDVSAPLLALARRRAAGFANTTFVEADAQTATLPGAPFDAVFSRFGVMFFDDPVAAFSNLHAAAAAAGGRLAFVCWQGADRNPWLLTPLLALLGLPGVELPPLPGPEDPGPYSLADPDRVRRILTAGGWRSVDVRAHEDEVVDDLDRRVALSLRQGPAARALANVDDDVRAAAAVRIRDALAPSTTDGVVRLARAAWIVTAHA